MNELLGKGQDLYEARIEICKECPLYIETMYDGYFGEICNPKLYINPETGDVKEFPQVDYVRGCGCRLRAKTRLDYEKCPANFW